MTAAEGYAYAVRVMAGAGQTAEAQEGVAAFLAKRPPKWQL